MDERPRFSFKVLLLGLEFMARSLEACDIDIREDIDRLKQTLSDDLQANYKEIEREKRTSEVDRTLIAFDSMAGEAEDKQYGLRSEEHYWRVGKWIKLDIRKVMPRYRRYCRGMGDIPAIADATQMGELLSGEVYFDRYEQHPEKPNVRLHVLDAKKMEDKGVTLTNLDDSADDYV